MIVSRGGNAHLNSRHFWNAEANGPTLSPKGQLGSSDPKSKIKDLNLNSFLPHHWFHSCLYTIKNFALFLF